MIDSYLTAESSNLQCISQDYTIFVHLFLISSLIQIPTNFELLRVIAFREATTASTSQTQAFVLSLLRYFHAFPLPAQNTDYDTLKSTQELANKVKSFFVGPQTFSMLTTTTSLLPVMEQPFAVLKIMAVVGRVIFIRNIIVAATKPTSINQIRGHADDVARH